MKEYLLCNPQVFVTFIIGVFTLFITWWFNRNNLKITNQKMEKELFKEFNERYDKLNDDLSKLDTVGNLSQLKEIKSNRDVNKTMYNVLMDYFNLCSEQYYWYKRNRISQEIWDSWYSGMMFYYNSFPIVKEVWLNEIRDGGYKSYYLKEKDELFK